MKTTAMWCRGKRRKLWLGLSLVVLAVAGICVSMVLTARKCEKSGISRGCNCPNSANNSKQTSMSLRSNREGWFFSTPRMFGWHRKMGTWAVHLQNLALELDLRSIFSPTWKVRSSQVKKLDVWLGSAPEEARNKRIILRFRSLGPPSQRNVHAGARDHLRSIHSSVQIVDPRTFLRRSPGQFFG